MSPPDKSDHAPAVQHREITPDQAGQRLDNFLLRHLKGVPRSRIYRIVRKGEVRVNGKRVKPEYKLCTGDTVRIPPVRTAAPAQPVSPSGELARLLLDAMLFEDDTLLVINKPAGLSVHGGTGVKLGLVEALRQTMPDGERIELVHRLDRGTSGCLLLARNSSALKKLSEQFKTREVGKVYHALVEGVWPGDLTEVSAALHKNRPVSGSSLVSVSERGKAATTRFAVLETFSGATLVEARPLTGRTHQIRVHAKLAGHPVIGDEKYAGKQATRAFRKMGIGRLCLHAAELALIHPKTAHTLNIRAPRDDKFIRALELLRQAGD